LVGQLYAQAELATKVWPKCVETSLGLLASL